MPITGSYVDWGRLAALVVLFLVFWCVLFPFLWRLPGWIRRGYHRLAWRRAWRRCGDCVPEQWESQVRR